MTKMEIILIILCVAFLFLAGFFIPVLLQIRRTAKGMAETLQHLNQGLPLIMNNLEEITTNINRTTTAVHLQVAELSLTLRRIQGILGVFFELEDVLRRRVSSRTFHTSLAVVKGVRAFVRGLTDGSPDERGGNASLQR